MCDHGPIWNQSPKEPNSQTSLLQLTRIFGFNWQITFLFLTIIDRLENESVNQTVKLALQEQRLVFSIVWKAYPPLKLKHFSTTLINLVKFLFRYSLLGHLFCCGTLYQLSTLLPNHATLHTINSGKLLSHFHAFLT